MNDSILVTHSEELLKSCDKSVRKWVGGFTPKRYVAFVVTIVFLYTLIYLVAQGMGWEHDDKKLSDHYTHVIIMGIFATVVYLFGNYNNTFSLETIIGMFIGCFGIAYLGSLPGFNFSFQSLSQIGIIPKITIGVIALLFLIVLFVTYRMYKRCDFTKFYWIFMSIPFIILAFAYLVAFMDNEAGETVQVHLHHWQWAIPFLFLMRFPGSKIQALATGAFFGIFIDGIARYGSDPLFNVPE